MAVNWAKVLTVVTVPPLPPVVLLHTYQHDEACVTLLRNSPSILSSISGISNVCDGCSFGDFGALGKYLFSWSRYS